MQLGMIGLGRMGSNIVRRLARHGHTCVVYDRNTKAMDDLAGDGIAASKGLDDLVAKLAVPRAVWVMLPAGRATEDAVDELAAHLQSGDVVIDGGNTFYKDDIRRAQAL